MIRQVTNGMTCNVAGVDGSLGDLQAIAAVLEGEVEIFIAGTPAGTEKKGIELNPFSFSLGKKYLGGKRRSTSVQLKHMKPTKTFSDVVTHIKGVWDADLSTEDKCGYVNGLRATSKGGIA